MNICVYVCEGLSEEIIQGCCVQLSNVYVCLCVKACLKRSFKAAVYSCPMCRSDLSEEFELNVNDHLQTALSTLFPGYDNGR